MRRRVLEAGRLVDPAGEVPDGVVYEVDEREAPVMRGAAMSPRVTTMLPSGSFARSRSAMAGEELDPCHGHSPSHERHGDSTGSDGELQRGAGSASWARSSTDCSITTGSNSGPGAVVEVRRLLPGSQMARPIATGASASKTVADSISTSRSSRKTHAQFPRLERRP